MLRSFFLSFAVGLAPLSLVGAAQAQFSSAGAVPSVPSDPTVNSSAYQRDDGSAENAVGLINPGSFAWLQSYTVLPGKQTIAAIQIGFGVPVSMNGRAVTAYLWSDPNQDGNPADAAVLASKAATVSGSSSGLPITNAPFAIFDIPDVTLPVGQKFFVGAVMQSTNGTGEYPAAQDQTTFPPANISWAAFGNTGALDPNALPNVTDMSTLSASLLSGNWLVRADVPEPACTALALATTIVVIRPRRR